MKHFVLWLCGAALAAMSPLYAQKQWWEQEPLRIIDLTTSMSQIDYKDPAKLAAEKAGFGYNAEHFEVMGMPGRSR